MDTTKEAFDIKNRIDNQDRLGALNMLSSDFHSLSVVDFRRLLKETQAATIGDKFGHLTFTETKEIAGQHFDVTVTPQVNRSDANFAVGSLGEAFGNIPDRGDSQTTYEQNPNGSSANILIKAYR